MPQSTCSVESCTSGGKLRHGMCNRHYIRWRKYGDPLGVAPPRVREVKAKAACSIEGCTRPAGTRGWCKAHYHRWYKYGDPLGTPKTPPTHGTRAMYARGCRCDGCKAAEAAYKKAWKAKNPEKVAKYFKDWHLKNKGQRNARRLELYRTNKAQELAKARLYLYGLTQEAFAALVALQGGACAICGEIPAPGVQLHVDHDHACCPSGKKGCGKCVRGLICQRCNHALGLMRDNPALLRTAADYLERARLNAALPRNLWLAAVVRPPGGPSRKRQAPTCLDRRRGCG